MSSPEIVVITGMSGAGRTEALHALEDIGFYCVDNLPPTLLDTFSQLAGLPEEIGRRLAVTCDLRSRELFGHFHDAIHRILAAGTSCTVVFLDANDETLRRRYSSLRRKHPLAGNDITLSEAIEAERASLELIRERANLVIDTSAMRPRDLKAMLIDEFSDTSAIRGLNVSIFSFGYKYGLPLVADLVIDVRFLPNPFYDPQLRDLSGLDDAVRDYVLQSEETQVFLKTWFAFLDVVMPGYIKEGKQHLAIALGCTGGRHRSVVVARLTAQYLSEHGFHVSAGHRDIARGSSSQ